MTEKSQGFNPPPYVASRDASQQVPTQPESNTQVQTAQLVDVSIPQRQQSLPQPISPQVEISMQQQPSSPQEGFSVQQSAALGGYNGYPTHQTAAGQTIVYVPVPQQQYAYNQHPNIEVKTDVHNAQYHPPPPPPQEQHSGIGGVGRFFACLVGVVWCILANALC